MSEMYDSEDGKDAWKQYRRLIESIDPAVQSMLHTFGSEQYQYGYSDALNAARDALDPLLHEEPCDCDNCRLITTAQVLIDALRSSPVLLATSQESAYQLEDSDD